MTYEEAKMQIQAIPGKIWDQLSEPDREAMEMAFSALEAQEWIPVDKKSQPLIRCRDCKHYKAYEYSGRLACHYVIGGVVVRNPDDFCSRAERLRNGSD